MGGTLLLADDSITIQKVVELTFAETEHKVVTVGSGRDLFGRLPEVKPDVVLCDVVMPDMNGYEVCQTLKSDPNTLHLPVVLLTGTFEPFDRDRAVAAGCDAIVTKPFEARELINVVEDLLKRAQLVAALPMPGEAGGLGDQGIPEGVPSLDFSTTGFEQLASKIPPPPPMPEEGIELTSSALGNSHPSSPMPVPPELAGPAASPEVPAVPQSFAFGGDEPEVVIEPPGFEPAPMGEAFAQPEFPSGPEDRTFETMKAPTPERLLPAPDPPAFAPEPEAISSPAAEPFLAAEPHSESAQELFGSEPSPEDVIAPEPPAALLAPEPAFEDGPTQSFLVQPVSGPVAQPVAPPPAEPLAAGAVSAEVVEHIARRVKEMIPQALFVPATPPPPEPLAAGAVSDEVVENIARRVKEMMPQALFVPATPPPPEPLSEEHVERIARRAAELVPQPPAPATVPAELSEEQIDTIAKRVIELSAPQLERIAWEVIPDMAEMMVRKRIAELEKAAEEDS